MTLPRFLLRAASFGALILFVIAGLNWLLSGSGRIPDLAAAPTTTISAGPGPNGTRAADPPLTPTMLPFQPTGLSSYPGDLHFTWVDGPVGGFYYADVSTDGQALGQIEFGSIRGGWCDRSADGGVLAFVHEKVRSLGAVGFADQPAALRWLNLPDLSWVNEPLPDMQIMSPPVFAPSGYRLAFSACPADGNCGLFVYDLETQALDRISPHQPVAPVLWSPDAMELAFQIRIGDQLELHIISAATGQTDFIAPVPGPNVPLFAWAKPFPAAVEGVERCETAGGALPAPLGLDADSEAIRQRLLYSHMFWHSMWVDARLDDFNGAIAASQRVQVWLDQPARARVLSGPVDGVPGLLWISDGELTRLGEEVHVPPFDPPKTESEVVFPHPMTGILPTPLSSLLFPSGLAQRGGTYQAIEVESIAGREALVVEWTAPSGEVVDRFWVDAVTGVILRAQTYGKDGGGALTSDHQVTAIAYNLDPALFSGLVFNRLAPFPPAYASGSEDIYAEAPPAAPSGTPETSLEFGEIYLQLNPSPGSGPTAMVRFPAACLVIGGLCPQPEPVRNVPEGFGYARNGWSPDGTQLVYPVSGLADEVWMFVRPLHQWIRFDVPPFSGAVWSADSDWLAGQPVIYGEPAGSPIVIVRQDGFGWQEVLGDEPGIKSPFGWADWHSILFVNMLDNEVSDDDPYVYSEIALYDTQSGQVEILTGLRSDANAGQLGIPVLSPDRSRFAFAFSDYRTGASDVTVYDLATRSEESFTFDQPGEITWAPDGQRLVLTSALAYTCEIRLIPADGGDGRLLYTGDWGGGCRATWSPDGVYLLVSASTRTPTVPRLTVIEVATGTARTVELPDVGVPFEWPEVFWVP